MIERHPALVLVDERKGGAGNLIGNAEAAGNAARKGRFSHAHRPEKGDHFAAGKAGTEPFAERFRLLPGVRRHTHGKPQNKPEITPASSTSIFWAAGAFGRPGIVMISPA